MQVGTAVSFLNLKPANLQPADSGNVECGDDYDTKPVELPRLLSKVEAFLNIA